MKKLFFIFFIFKAYASDYTRQIIQELNSKRYSSAISMIKSSSSASLRKRIKGYFQGAHYNGMPVYFYAQLIQNSTQRQKIMSEIKMKIGKMLDQNSFGQFLSGFVASEVILGSANQQMLIEATKNEL